MGLVIDSSVLISAERGTIDWKNLVTHLSAESPFISAITLSELWHGCHRGQGPKLKKRLKFIGEIEALLPVLPFAAAEARIHAKIWADLEKATKSATRQPGKTFLVGEKISVDRKGNWLRIRLPSGRYLCYPGPQEAEYDSSFLGVDPYTKQWKRISTYSGKRAENIVQAGSADLLMDWLLLADAEGYDPVLSVHDEIICEPRDDVRFTDQGLSALVAHIAPPGLPLTAKGKTQYRYSK